MADERADLGFTGEELDEVLRWLALIRYELALLRWEVREATEEMKASSARRGREIIFPIRPEEIFRYGRRD